MGTEAHVCVLLTGIDLKAAGFQPVIVADAVTSRSAADMNIGIERAVQEGILVTTSESVLYALTMSSNHPKFKEISELIK
jgi:nicotinamidase-related amidase